MRCSVGILTLCIRPSALDLMSVVLNFGEPIATFLIRCISGDDSPGAASASPVVVLDLHARSRHELRFTPKPHLTGGDSPCS
jgi:hypothetical protein